MCGSFGLKTDEDVVGNLKRLKALALIDRDFGISGEEQLFPLKMKIPNLKRKRLPKRLRKEMKECRILGRSARWIFFLAPLKNTMTLLADKKIEVEETSISELLLWLARAKAAALEEQES